MFRFITDLMATFILVNQSTDVEIYFTTMFVLKQVCFTFKSQCNLGETTEIPHIFCFFVILLWYK